LALRVRPHIADIQPGTHGGINFCTPAGSDEEILEHPSDCRGHCGGLAMTGLKGAGSKTSLREAQRRSNLSRRSKDILDFSTCCNPFGPPPEVRRAIRKADIENYPDPQSSELVKALSQKLGIPAANMMAGSGSTEVIRLAAQAYLEARDTVVIPSPTYGEYELASRIAGACVVKYKLREEQDFQLDMDNYISFARVHNPKAIFLCNPNNPCGQLLPHGDVRRLVKAFPHALVILDEAYLGFSPDPGNAPALINEPNVLVIRSMTKDYALAGLRLGYGIACLEIIKNLEKVRPPWNVSSPAQQAGIAAAGCSDYMRECNVRLQKCKTYLESSLFKLGYKTVPTDTHFFLVKVGDAALFKSRLLERGFLVRDCASFGLPDYVRISPRRMGDCRKLIKAVTKLAGKAD
jgi:histidinol-phosphate aminotransferase